MKGIVSDLQYFIKDRFLMWPVVLATFLSYAYFILNPTVSIDDTALSIYYQHGELIAQGRFGTVLLAFILQLVSFRVVIVEALGVIIFIVASLLWCVVIKRATNNRLHPRAYVVFAVALLTYPLINEVFIYQMAVLPITLGYLFTALGLLGLQHYFVTKQRSVFLGVVGLLGYTLSMVESFAPVFLLGFLIIVLLEQLFNPLDSIKAIVRKLITVGLVLLLAMGIKYGVTALLVRIFNLQLSGVAATDIVWLNFDFMTTLQRLMVEVFYRYGLASFYYFPMTMLALVMIVGFMLFLRLSVQQRNGMLIFLYGLVVLSLFSLSVLQGTATPYRASQALAVFVGFILMLVTHFGIVNIKRTGLKGLVIGSVVLGLFYQVNDLNQWFHVEKMRHDEETITLIAVGQLIQQSYGFDKPVIFTGTYVLSDNIKSYTYLRKDSVGGRIYESMKTLLSLSDLESEDDRYLLKMTQSAGNSFITWSIAAFGQTNQALLTYMRSLGFDIKPGTSSMIEAALYKSHDMPRWPHAGSVVEEDEYILVHF